MSLKRIRKFVIDYFSMTLDTLNDATFENLKYDKNIIVNSYILYPIDNYVDGKFNLIAQNLEGLEEIEMLWCIYCRHLYTRGGYKETIYAVVREIANEYKCLLIILIQEKINYSISKQLKTLRDVLNLPYDIIIYIGNYLYPKLIHNLLSSVSSSLI